MPSTASFMAMVMAGSLLEIEPGILRFEGKQTLHFVGELAFDCSNGPGLDHHHHILCICSVTLHLPKFSLPSRLLFEDDVVRVKHDNLCDTYLHTNC